MTQLLDPIEDRIVAILECERGRFAIDGTVPFAPTTDTLARYFPSKRLRRSSYAAPLIDPAYPAGSFDRSYDIKWTTLAEDPDPQNPLDSTQEVELGFDLDVGFAYGRETPQFVSLVGTEVALDAATFARKRALSEMHRILRSLTFPAIFDGDLGQSMTFVEMTRALNTKVTLDDRGGGRLIATASMAILIEVPTGTSFDP